MLSNNESFKLDKVKFEEISTVDEQYSELEEIKKDVSDIAKGFLDLSQVIKEQHESILILTDNINTSNKEIEQATNDIKDISNFNFIITSSVIGGLLGGLIGGPIGLIIGTKTAITTGIMSSGIGVISGWLISKNKIENIKV